MSHLLFSMVQVVESRRETPAATAKRIAPTCEQDSANLKKTKKKCKENSAKKSTARLLGFLGDACFSEANDAMQTYKKYNLPSHTITVSSNNFSVVFCDDPGF